MIIGYTTGVYDLFHIGHLNLLRNAKSMCDKLIVGLTTDEIMMEYKNKNTVIPYQERYEILRSVRYVDAVVPQNHMNKFDAWERLKFDVMFVGDDWFQSEKWKTLDQQFKEVDVKIVYFPYTQGTSSTLVNEILLERRKEIQQDTTPK